MLLIGGDFNSKVGDLNNFPEGFLSDSNLLDTRTSTDNNINARGRLLSNFMSDHGLVLLNGRTSSDHPAKITFCSHQGSSIIDLVWVNIEDVDKIIDLEITYNSTLSDHFPVLVTLLMKKQIKKEQINQNISPQKKLVWHENRKTEFAEAMLWSPNVANCTREINISDMYENLVETIKNIAEKCGLIKLRTFESKRQSKPPWFDLECIKSKNLLNKSLRQCRKSDFSENDRLLWLNCKKDFKTITKSKHREWEIKLINSFAEVRNTTQFWETYKIFQRKSINYEMPSIQIWNSFLEQLFPPRIISDVQFIGVLDPLLDADITYQEVLVVLKDCKNGKAPGEDQIPNEFLKALPENWCLYLTTLFARIWEEERVPQNFSNVISTMLYKKGDRMNPQNYRSIALINTQTKQFTQLICNRLVKWVNRVNLFSPYQSGFIAGRSCLDNVFILLSLSQKKLNQVNGKLYSVMIDFKRAFDSIPHNLLWAHLYEIGVSAKIIRIMSYFYQNAKLKINVKGSLSNSADITEGVLQGEILSPLLFILYISDIDEFFRSKGFDGVWIDDQNDVIVLLYADDLILFAHSPRDLRSKLLALNEYCELKGLTVNVEKTKVMIFKKGGGRLKKSERNFVYRDKPLEIVNTFEYLGITISRSTLGLNATNTAISKTRKALGALLSTLNRAKIDSWETRVKLFDTTILSILLYGAPVWGLRYVEELEVIQTDFYKRLLLLPRNTPHCIIRLECGATRIALKLLSLTWKFIIRILKMENSRLPKICLTKMQSSYLPTSNPKYNWVSQLEKMLQVIDYSWIVNETDPKVWISNEAVALNLYANYLRALDYEEAINCNALQLRFDYLYTTPFSNFRCPPNFCKLLAQLRMSSKYICKITFSTHTFIINPKEKCTICNLNEMETLEHIILNCPQYTPFRIHFIKPLLSAQENADVNINVNNLLCDILNCETVVKMKKVYFYIVNCMRLRAFLRNE